DEPRCVSLLAARAGEGARLSFLAGPDAGVDVRPALKAALDVLGGRGGGRPDRAQGAGQDASRLEGALAAAVSTLAGCALLAPRGPRSVRRRAAGVRHGRRRHRASPPDCLSCGQGAAAVAPAGGDMAKKSRAKGKLYESKIDLPEERRAALVELCNQLLADTFDL